MSAHVHHASLDPTTTTSPQPLVQCAACGKEPRDVVETPCCGDVWCWQCAVTRPPSQTLCACGQQLSVEDFRPAKAIQALLKRKQGAASRSLADLTCHDLLACPENCGAVLPVGSLEEHIKTCGEVEEPCPNGCYERNLKRKDVPAHVRDDCPLATVSCKFGCDETILRRELDDHMKDNVAAHLEWLHFTVEAQRARIALLENDKALVQADRRRCISFLLKARKAAMIALSAVVLLMLMVVLVRNPMAAKVSLAVGLLVILRLAFNYWAGRRPLGRHRPFRPVETNALFGMLCVAVFLTLWPILFATFML